MNYKEKYIQLCEYALYFFYKFYHDLLLGYSRCGRFGVNKWYEELIRLIKVTLRDLNITSIN